MTDTAPTSNRPDFRYRGWQMVSALSFTTLVSYGVLFYAFGVMTSPMEHEFGWTRFQTSIAFSLASLTNGLSSVWAGRMVDRRGARVLMTLGSIAGSLLVVAWSYVHTRLQLYVVWALIGITWTAVFYEVAFAVVARWFRRDRARGTFTITMVAGFASTLFIPLTTALVEHHGWRRALRILAVVLAAVTIPLHAMVLRRDPADHGLRVDGARHLTEEHHDPEPSVTATEARRGAVFWRIAIAFALARTIASAMSAHLVPMLRESGHSAHTTALVAGSVGPMQVLGRILFFPLHRRLSLRRLTIATFAMFLGAFTTLVLALHGSAVWIYVVLYGSANGIITLNRASLTVERFGPAEFGRISGSMGMLAALMSAASPFAAGWLRTSSGNYHTVLIVLAVGAVLAAISVRGIGERTSLAAEAARNAQPSCTGTETRR